MEGNGKCGELLIPSFIPRNKIPDLLRYWYLGSRARRYISRRRMEAVTDCIPLAHRLSVLDVGCGAGLTLALLGRRGFRPVGIDLVADGFYAARRIGEANGLEPRLVNADVSRLPFQPSTFHAVTAVEMLEHVFEADRRRAFAELARVIHPGGMLILSTPNYGSFVEIAKRLLYKSRVLRRLLPFMHYPTPDVDRASYHPYAYHLPIPLRNLRKSLGDEAFTVVTTKKFLFTLKYTPDGLFNIVKWFENILERLPFVREFACTVLVIAVKGGK